MRQQPAPDHDDDDGEVTVLVDGPTVLAPDPGRLARASTDLADELAGMPDHADELAGLPDHDPLVDGPTTMAFDQQPMALEPGARVGRLVVLRTLASGGSGSVTLAYDPELDRHVALKVLLPEVWRLAGPAARERLQREAMVMAKLAHPNIVAVYDVGAWFDQAYVAMEYVEGPTLLDWIQVEPRSWRQVLDVLLAAGRGLAAASASGVVHRDVKPANILCGTDGRVRVTDFGIAALVHEASEAEGGSGLVSGTPGYMSPEQMLGGVTDERSDQFSFCVTAWEALGGVQPFQGDSLASLLHAIHSRHIRYNPAARVPGAIRRVLLRGLSPEPAARYRSMTELLDALEAAAGLRRRWLGVGALAAAFVTAAAIGALAGGHATRSGETCGGSAERLRGVWDADRRGAVERAFGAADLRDPAGSFARFAAALDRRTGRWVEARTDACRATRVTAEQSETVLEARLQCLDDQLHAIDSLVAAVSRGDGSMFSALEAAHVLPDPESCSATALRARGQEAPFAEDPDARARAAELDQLLARARTAIAVVDLDGADQALAAADEVSAVLPDPVRRARVQYERGRAAEARSQFDQAASHYSEATRTAAAAGAEAVVADAAARMAYLVGVHRQEPDAALPWQAAVDLQLARGVGGDRLRGFVEETRAKMAFQAHRLAEARDLAERSMELFRRASGEPDDPRTLSPMRLVAAARTALGDRAGAAELYRRALEIAEKAYGPEHPEVAHTLTMIGRADADGGDLVAARAAFERALAVRERAFGADDPRVAESLGDLGIVAAAQGDHEVAERNLRRWLATEERIDPDGPNLPAPLINLGSLLIDVGRPDEARHHLERAVALYEKARGPGFPGLVAPLLELAELERARAGCQAAGPLLTRALDIADRVPEGDPTPSYVLIPLAVCEAEAGRGQRALRLARRAARLREAVQMPPTSLAEARFAEAHALWASGRRRDARRLATEARASADPDLASHIDAWLKKPPRRRRL